METFATLRSWRTPATTNPWMAVASLNSIQYQYQSGTVTWIPKIPMKGLCCYISTWERWVQMWRETTHKMKIPNPPNPAAIRARRTVILFTLQIPVYHRRRCLQKSIMLTGGCSRNSACTHSNLNPCLAALSLFSSMILGMCDMTV